MTWTSLIDGLHAGLGRLPRHTILVPTVIGASMIVLITIVWLVTPTTETTGYATEARNDLGNFSARLESHIATRLAIGEQLRRLLIGGQIKDRDDFLTQTSYIHELFTDFQAISWVDSLGVIRWVSPLKGNEQAQNLDVKKLKLPGIALARAEETGRLQITPPIELAQGGVGFVAYIPVLKMGRVTGFVNIIFRADPLIRAAMADDMLDKYEVMIQDETSPLFTTFSETAERDDAFHKWIVIGNRVWAVTLQPKAQVIAAYGTIVDELVLVTLILLCIVIAWLIHLAMVRQLRIKASDKLFRTFIENSPSAIIIKDAEGRYIHANSQWHEWFNPEGRDIRGLTSEEVFPAGYAEEVRRQEEQILDRRDMIEKEYLSPLTGGGTVPTFVQMFPITDDTGEVIAIGGSITDISLNKKTEETLRLALIKAEEASQSKSKFLATMSHELRTPLNAIIGFSDILLGEYFGPVGSAKYMEYAEDINHSGRHLLSLINEVLDISAIELGKRELVLEPLVVQDLLSDCVKSVRHRAETQGLTVALNADSSLPPISADETAVRQIFLNLLTNAIKFSHAGDKIIVTARAADEAVVITVADTGEGINKEQLASVTEPFVKGHSTSHITHEGVGLGLSIVKSFVAAHKGTLHIESEVGRGTTVTVTLPKENGRMVA
ncbi:PAS domain-containing protein [Sneathiella chungangensis]|uniref:histidine kinase n=1 Tax=Sneathiella chungangensis TaxID=1418234 RepID=A0A845MFM6_9PROT|nr:ATP-binding protein [Sneathiella chungangensis]MZR22240.1 PAS domain-containing protein [Sneathiella chungangensis]